MKNSFILAGVQMDCKLGDKASNLAAIDSHTRTAAQKGAKLVAFPECAITGYCFDSKEEAWEYAEPIPGPGCEAVASLCHELNVFIITGTLERAGDDLFNSCVLIGPDGLVGTHRKIHLPFLGVDRFTTPGDRPFAVHNMGGVTIGMIICYDGSFPESVRVLTLLGADLVVLPTNWPPGSECAAQCVSNARAMENHIYFAGVNRIGEERGFKFIGQSRIVNPHGVSLAAANETESTILYGEIDPELARNKRLIRVPGKHEINRIADRRPEMYGPLVAG